MKQLEYTFEISFDKICYNNDMHCVFITIWYALCILNY